MSHGEIRADPCHPTLRGDPPCTAERHARKAWRPDRRRVHGCPPPTSYNRVIDRLLLTPPFMHRLLLATALLAVATPAAASAQAPVIPYIESVGSAESRAVPDRAMVTLSVETTGATASGVATTNARLQRQV